MVPVIVKTTDRSLGPFWINGEWYVWSIFDNAWVTLAYWRWVNGKR